MARQIVPVPLADRICVTPAEAGALIGRSEDFVRRQVSAGHLRPVPHADLILIAVDEPRRWARGEAA